MPADDPYKVLELTSGADSAAIQRQYNKLKREKRGNDDAIGKIEAAHSTLMMRNLSARMQGNVEVAKEIKYADKEVYLPWRPRKHRAEKQLFLIVAAAQAVLFYWNAKSAAAHLQPTFLAATFGFGANIYKQNQIFPKSEEDKTKGMRNILRGAFLAFIATFAGTLLTSLFPVYAAKALGKEMPWWFFDYQYKFTALGSIISNFLMTAFYR